MNRLHEPLPRLLTPTLASALGSSPVVVVTGARQTGKTTLVRLPEIGEGRLYRSLDDFDVHERALARPESLVREGERMTLDEVQRSPELLRAVKAAVDRDRRPGRFLLTGSANLLRMRRISESLAGRAAYLHLGPMTPSELAGRGGCAPWSVLMDAKGLDEIWAGLSGLSGLPDWHQRALAGGYPVPARAGSEERLRWFDGYVRTYLERDLQEVSSVGSLVDFRRLMRMAALRIGQMLNQAELARDAALAQPTAHRYLNLLETSFQVARVPAYAVNRTRRMIKTPRLYWTDPGLGAFLAGHDSLRPGQEDVPSGAFLENLVLLDLQAWAETRLPRPEIHYWRTAAGHEVDFVIQAGRRLLPVEVKLSSRLRSDELAPLEGLLADYGRQAPFGIVLYGGKEPVRWSDRIAALPLGFLLAEG